MTIMMGNSNKKKSLLDLVSNPEKLQAQIKAHEEATEARNKAATEFNKQKSAAEDSIKELRVRQSALAAYQEQLDQRKSQYDSWENELFKKRDELIRLQQELEEGQKAFEIMQTGAVQSLKEKSNQAAKIQSELDRKHEEVTKKLGDAELKHYELLNREHSVTKREAFLISVSHQLKA